MWWRQYVSLIYFVALNKIGLILSPRTKTWAKGVGRVATCIIFNSPALFISLMKSLFQGIFHKNSCCFFFYCSWCLVPCVGCQSATVHQQHSADCIYISYYLSFVRFIQIKFENMVPLKLRGRGGGGEEGQGRGLCCNLHYITAQRRFELIRVCYIRNSDVFLLAKYIPCQSENRVPLALGGVDNFPLIVFLRTYETTQLRILAK